MYKSYRRTEEETVQAYEEAGWDCIVVWETAIKDGFGLHDLDRFVEGG